MLTAFAKNGFSVKKHRHNHKPTLSKGSDIFLQLEKVGDDDYFGVLGLTTPQQWGDRIEFKATYIHAMVIANVMIQLPESRTTPTGLKYDPIRSDMMRTVVKFASTSEFVRQ